MRIIILAFCLGCLVVFDAQSCIRAGTAAQITTAQKLPLQLTTSLISQRYCAGDADVDVLQMNVRLTYTNVGQQKILLYKGSNLVSRQMVSHSVEDAIAQRFEINSSLTQVGSDSGAKIGMSAPSDAFVTLLPGTSYETEAAISIVVSRNDVNTVSGAITAGEHVIQVELPTWPESSQLAKKLHSSWQQSGCLWYLPIISMPMPFRVERERLVVDCS